MRRRVHEWTQATGDSFGVPGYELPAPGAERGGSTEMKKNQQ